MAIVDLDKRTFECGTPSCPNFAFVKMGMIKDDDGNNPLADVAKETRLMCDSKTHDSRKKL
jgi:hypothetical protein